MKKFELRITIELRQTDAAYSGGGLRIDETQQLTAESFLELAKILGRFHELGEQIAKERGAA